ncbi:hypothetical protein BT69DRAFT_1283270, partial [Atractiella rhizophila]
MAFSLIAPAPSYPLPSVSQLSSFIRDLSPSNPSPAKAKRPRPKPYKCLYAGCSNAYSRPSKLADHERSHTGDRPFRCLQCGKTYRKDQHLTVHMRTHLSEEDRTFVCANEECGKRFWTATHLKIHVKSQHDVSAEGKRYQCPDCPQHFRKHHLLRSHMHLNHPTSSALPFPCTHDNCSKSFDSASKLRAHMKSHDPNRYVCTHPNCLKEGMSASFSKWSDLQRHTKEFHPPKCHFDECREKTFGSRRNLRNHLRSQHGERGSENEGEGKKRKRGLEDFQGVGEEEEMFYCEREGCEQLIFKHSRALTYHVQRAHPELLKFLCSHDSCAYAALSRAVLNKHIQRQHPSSAPHLPPNLIPTSNPLPSSSYPGNPSLEPVTYLSA